MILYMKEELLINVRVVEAISQEDVSQAIFLFQMKLALHLRYLLMKQSETCSFDQPLSSAQRERKLETIRKDDTYVRGYRWCSRSLYLYIDNEISSWQPQMNQCCRSTVWSRNTIIPGRPYLVAWQQRNARGNSLSHHRSS